MFKGFIVSKREWFLFDVEKRFFFFFPVNLSHSLDFLVGRPRCSYVLDVAFVSILNDRL